MELKYTKLFEEMTLNEKGLEWTANYEVAKKLSGKGEEVGAPIEDDFEKIFEPKLGDTFSVMNSRGIVTIEYKSKTYSIPRMDFEEYVKAGYFKLKK